MCCVIVWKLNNATESDRYIFIKAGIAFTKTDVSVLGVKEVGQPDAPDKHIAVTSRPVFEKPATMSGGFLRPVPFESGANWVAAS